VRNGRNQLSLMDIHMHLAEPSSQVADTRHRSGRPYPWRCGGE
jgi:hypothetical protein